jgi:hypothetical protein
MLYIYYMLEYIFRPIIIFLQWIFTPIIEHLKPSFFQANKNQFFINFLRFTMGCFFECFPISSSFFNTLLYRFQDEHKIYKNNVYIHCITGIASMILFIQLNIKNFHFSSPVLCFDFNSWIIQDSLK